MDINKLFESINVFEKDYYKKKQSSNDQKSNILTSFNEALANIKEQIEHKINIIFEKYDQDLDFLKTLTISTRNNLEEQKKKSGKNIINLEQIEILLQNLKKELDFYPDISNIFINEILMLKDFGQNLFEENINFLSSSFKMKKILEDLATNSANQNSEIDEIVFSEKNFDDIRLKREISTSHIHAEYEEMFNPCEIAINKIIHHQDNFYVSVGYDGKICIANILGKKVSQSLQAHKLTIRDIIKLEDNVYVTVSDDWNLKLWNLDTYQNQLLASLNTMNYKIRILAHNSKGLLNGIIVAGGDNGILIILKPYSLEEIYRTKISEYTISTIRFIDSDILIIGTSKGEIIFFSVTKKKVLSFNEKLHNDWISGFCITEYTCFSKISFLTYSYDFHINFCQVDLKASSFDIKVIKRIKLNDWIIKIENFEKSNVVIALRNEIIFLDLFGKVLKRISQIFNHSINYLIIRETEKSILLVGHDEQGIIKEFSD